MRASDSASAAPQEAGLTNGRRPFGRGRRSAMLEERVVFWLLRIAALVSIATTIAIVASLIGESVGFFREVTLKEFFTGTKWTPLFQPRQFGVLPLIAGTALVAVVAGVTAIGVGLGSAIYLSEYAPDKARRILKPALEVLAGIPTVVYGYFALTFVTPIIRFFLPETIIFNALSAGLVMGIMIMPMVSTLSEDAMVAVPRSLRDGAYALGATRFETAIRVVLPAALPGVMASFILGISRAIGETMIVTIAAGSTPKLTFNPLESIQTMTAYIVQISLGETPHGTVEFRTLFAVGLLLFLITLALNVAGKWLVSRFAERYV
jgi:phosphate transport system permease protein